MSDTVKFEQSGMVARLTFNRPERRNALGRAELDAILGGLNNLASDTRVLVITASGGTTFCAGADLQQIRAGELDGDQFQAVTNTLADLLIPTVCVINGNVFGGGVELALSCDFRLAADDVVMRVPASAIGLCYPVAGIERFVSRLGVTLTKRILLGAEEFTAAEMLQLDIVGGLANPEVLQDRAELMVQSLTQRAPLAVRAMLRIIRQAEQGAINWQEAQQLADRCSNSEDLKEGLAAQKERRLPRFKGL